MKKSFKFLAIAFGVLFLLSGGQAFAGLNVSGDGVRGDANCVYTAVYNSSGSTLQSGAVVIWDTTSTNADSTLGAYVTTTTSADSNLAAGVVVSDSIVSGGIGTICVYGPAYALRAQATDGGTDTVGTALGTTSVAGQFGDGSGLGFALETTANSASGNLSGDYKRVIIFVNPSGGA